MRLLARGFLAAALIAGMIGAAFAQIFVHQAPPSPQYTIALSAAPAAGGTVSGGGTFNAGTMHTVIASPASGYQFVNWTDPSSNIISTSASYTFTLTASVTYAANFMMNTAGPIIPADRLYAWNPGVTYNGGIPARATTCSTLNPISGADNAPQIQAAINACPAGQTVFLNAGTYQLSGKQNSPVINKAITLRGAGAGLTILDKTNGAMNRTTTQATGTTGMFNGVADYTYMFTTSHDIAPVLWVGTGQDEANADNSTSVNLTADGVKDGTSIQVASAAGLTVGQIVLIDEASMESWQPSPPGSGTIKQWAGDRVLWHLHLPVQPTDGCAGSACGADATGPYESCCSPRVWPGVYGWFSRVNPASPSEDRVTNEMKEISSINGTTVTFTSPLAITYRVSHHAQLSQYTSFPILGKGADGGGAGVEGMTLKHGLDGGVRFNNTAYCWAKNIEVDLADGNAIGGSVSFDNAFRCEVRDSYIHRVSYPEPGGDGYHLTISRGSSDILAENNIIIDANKVMVARAGGAGSVIAYNYVDDGWIQGSEWWEEAGLNASHWPGPHHVLFEGNYAFKVSSDFTWGNNVYQTFFRNVVTGLRRDFPPANFAGDLTENFGTDSNAGAWWHSFVGNVLGTPGQTTAANGWVYTNPSLNCDANGNNCTGNGSAWSDCCSIWAYGDDPTAPGPHWNPDTKVTGTIIRDGNYDYLTGSQRWHNTPGGFAMPNSLYLTAKPAFFGSNPWPWSDPSAGTVNVLPAKARYDAGMPNG